MKNAKRLITKENIDSVTQENPIGFILGEINGFCTKGFLMKVDFFSQEYIAMSSHKIHLHNTLRFFGGVDLRGAIQSLINYQKQITIYSFKNERCLLRWLATE